LPLIVPKSSELWVVDLKYNNEICNPANGIADKFKGSKKTKGTKLWELSSPCAVKTTAVSAGYMSGYHVQRWPNTMIISFFFAAINFSNYQSLYTRRTLPKNQQCSLCPQYVSRHRPRTIHHKCCVAEYMNIKSLYVSELSEFYIRSLQIYLKYI